MYGYIYDTFLNDKRYQKELIKIENSLTDLELRGQIVRLSLISNLGHAVQDMLQRGVTTIITVGSDQLFSKLIDHADKLERVTLGMIPLGNHQRLAGLFGVPEGADACPVLAARLIADVPLGKINNGYFIDSVLIQDPRVQVGCDNRFFISATTEQSVTSIHNLIKRDGEQEKKSLSVYIQPELPKKFMRKSESIAPTVLHGEQIQIEHPQNIQIVVDGQKIMKTPVVLETAKKKIRVIVGKGRKI